METQAKKARPDTRGKILAKLASHKEDPEVVAAEDRADNSVKSGKVCNTRRDRGFDFSIPRCTKCSSKGHLRGSCTSEGGWVIWCGNRMQEDKEEKEREDKEERDAHKASTDELKLAKKTARQLPFAQEKRKSSWENIPEVLLAKILDELRWDRRVSGLIRHVCHSWKSAHDNTVKKMVISNTVEKGSPIYLRALRKDIDKNIVQRHAPMEYWIGSFQRFTCLEEFRMGGANERNNESIWMSNKSLKKLAESCPKLTRVEVTHGDTDDDAVDELVKYRPEVLRLNLSFNRRITLESEETSDDENFTGRTDGPEYVTGLASATSLTHLNLRGNFRIGENGLLSLMTLQALKHLNVSSIGPGVSNVVFKQLVTRLPSLTYLDVSASGVDDEGLFALHDVTLVPLKHLALQNIHTVTNRGLHEAARFRTLKVLDVQQCGHVKMDLIQSFSVVWFTFNPSTPPPTIKAHMRGLLQGVLNAPVALD